MCAAGQPPVVPPTALRELCCGFYVWRLLALVIHSPGSQPQSGKQGQGVEYTDIWLRRLAAGCKTALWLVKLLGFGSERAAYLCRRSARHGDYTGHAHSFSRRACCCLRAVDKRMDEWRSEGDLVAVQGTALADVATPRAALLPTLSGACVHVPQKPCSAGFCVSVFTIVMVCLGFPNN